MNTITTLINIGLIAIPFACIDGQNTRDIKFYIALCLSFVIGYLLNREQLRPFNKKFTLCAMGMIPLSIIFCHKFNIKLGTTKLLGAYIWQTTVYLLVFLSFLIKMCCAKFNFTQKESIYKTISWVGLIISIHCIGQFILGIDQFGFVNDNPESLYVPSNIVSSTLGHPTIAGSFIAMLLPIMWYRGYKLMLPFGIVAVCMTQSQVAIGAMLVSGLVYVGLTNKRNALISLSIVVISASILIGGYFVSPSVKSFVGDSGRFSEWGKIYKSFKTPISKNTKTPKIYTGKGPGTFKHIYHIKENSKFHQAHNEYLEVLYDFGILGLFLFVLALIELIKGVFVFQDRGNRALAASLVCVSISAGASFVWHLAPFIFYTIILIGLANKEV